MSPQVAQEPTLPNFWGQQQIQSIRRQHVVFLAMLRADLVMRHDGDATLSIEKAGHSYTSATIRGQAAASMMRTRKLRGAAA